MKLIKMYEDLDGTGWYIEFTDEGVFKRMFLTSAYLKEKMKADDTVWTVAKNLYMELKP